MLTWNSTISPAIAQVVLLISDHAVPPVVWVDTFREKGFTPVHETCENALKTCRIVDPALVVIDIDLPHTKRLEFCSKLRYVASCPILLLVPDYNSSQIADLFKVGVEECLLKPVNPAFLMVKALSWFLRKRWLEQDLDLPPVYTGL